MRTKNKKYKFCNAVDLPLPNSKLVIKYLNKFNDSTAKTILNSEISNSMNSVDTEKILDDLFENTFGNDTGNQLYLQCIALNHIYSVSVKHLMDLTKHIFVNKSLIKRAIDDGDYKIVDAFKRVKVNNKDGSISYFNYLSFFSKFLRRYRPDVFPIYDRVVKSYLINYYSISPNSSDNDKNKFLSEGSLDSYPVYIDAINTYIEHENYLNDIISKAHISPYVVVDRFIWQFGKDAEEIINNYKLLEKLVNLTTRSKPEEKKMNLLLKKYNLNIKLEKYIDDLVKGE